jgi:hypothetical protein
MVAVIGNLNQATYYTSHAGGCAAAFSGTTFCTYPSDEWGWAVVSGIEVKLDMLSPGSRVGGYFNYGVGATRFGGGNNLSSPGLFGSGNQVAWGMVTDTVYVNGSGQQATTSWSVGAGFEYFWTRNFSSTIYGSYTEVNYNSTVVNNRWFCGANGGAVQNVVLSAATACDPSFTYWTVGTHHDWFPVAGLRLAVDIMYNGIDSAVEGATITLSKTQGARPTGVYTAKNLGITSVIFRAQRSWGAGG